MRAGALQASNNSMISASSVGLTIRVFGFSFRVEDWDVRVEVSGFGVLEVFDG